jgi:hypothetical protein
MFTHPMSKADVKNQILIQSVPVEPVKPAAQRKAQHADSHSTIDFGKEFVRRNKNAAKDLKSVCTVTIHDYSNDRYEINGADISQRADKQVDLRFSDPETVEKQYPILKTGRPGWATVRYAGCSRLTSQ